MAPFVDSRGRLFGKVNLVDLAVLLVIIAVVLFAVLRPEISPDTVEVQVTLVVRSIDNRMLEQYETTGDMKDAGSNYLGSIESVDATPTLVEVPTPAGELKVFDSRTTSDVWLVVKARGTVDDSGVHIGSTVVRTGANLLVIGPGYEASAEVAEVRLSAEAPK